MYEDDNINDDAATHNVLHIKECKKSNIVVLVILSFFIIVSVLIVLINTFGVRDIKLSKREVTEAFICLDSIYINEHSNLWEGQKNNGEALEWLKKANDTIAVESSNKYKIIYISGWIGFDEREIERFGYSLSNSKGSEDSILYSENTCKDKTELPTQEEYSAPATGFCIPIDVLSLEAGDYTIKVYARTKDGQDYYMLTFFYTIKETNNIVVTSFDSIYVNEIGTLWKDIMVRAEMQ